MDHDEEALQHLKAKVLEEPDEEIWGPEHFSPINDIPAYGDNRIRVLIQLVEGGEILISKDALLRHLPLATLWIQSNELDIDLLADIFADKIPSFIYVRVACFVLEALEKHYRTGEINIDMFRFGREKMQSARRYSHAVVALSAFTRGLCFFLNNHEGLGCSEFFFRPIMEWCAELLPNVEMAVGRDEAVKLFDGLVHLSEEVTPELVEEIDRVLSNLSPRTRNHLIERMQASRGSFLA